MNAFSDVFAMLDQEKERLCPELRDPISEAIAQREKPQYDRAIPECCTEAGAKELLRQISQFWDRKEKYNRGAIKLWIEPMAIQLCPSSPTNRLFYCVRSNLISGLPAVRK